MAKEPVSKTGGALPRVGSSPTASASNLGRSGRPKFLGGF